MMIRPRSKDCSKGELRIRTQLLPVAKLPGQGYPDLSARSLSASHATHLLFSAAILQSIGMSEQPGVDEKVNDRAAWLTYGYPTAERFSRFHQRVWRGDRGRCSVHLGARPRFTCWRGCVCGFRRCASRRAVRPHTGLILQITACSWARARTPPWSHPHSMGQMASTPHRNTSRPCMSTLAERSAWPLSKTNTQARFPAVSASAPRSPAPWRSARTCC
jgi:hypothetical protein